MLRFPSGVGMGGEAGMLELPDKLVVGPLVLILTLEFALEHEGQ